ncbi:MAPEG family protein [Aeromonas bivalvium]|uniref:MAPEG family protein n=1 Tax=Aeromonas bivalvium TaxID=440079 RepID=UPI0038D0BBCA
MLLPVTLTYAGLLGLLFLLLSIWVVKRRAQFKVAIGEGDAPPLRAAIRAHGNFAEYVPLTLLLLALCELAGTAPLWLHLAGGMLLLGRMLHAIGIQIPKAPNMPRLFGTLLFWLSLTLLSVLALVTGLSAP